MELVIDEAFMTKCFTSAHPGSKICLKKFEEKNKNITAGSTNYTSKILQATAEYECDGQLLYESIIVKVPHMSPHFDYINQFGFYDKETYMYNKVLPKMANMLHKPPIPKHFYTTESGALVLQNLTDQGYAMRPHIPLDLVSTAQVLEGAAKIHAASVRMNELDPNVLVGAYTTESMCSKGMINSALNSSFEILLEVLKGLDVDPKVLQKFADYEPLVREGNILQIPNRRCQFNVLNHGDLNVTNMLFNKDQQPSAKGSPVVFVDWQTTRWNSPALEIIIIQMMGMDFVVYEQHHEQMLRTYLTTLNENLARLGSNQTYTAEDYRSDIVGCRLFQMYHLLWLGWFDISVTKKVDLSEDKVITLPKEDIEKIRHSESLKNRFLKWFRHFEKLGFFK